MDEAKQEEKKTKPRVKIREQDPLERETVIVRL